VVVTVGEAVILAPVLALSPDEGDQLYDAAPLAERFVDCDVQTVSIDGVTLIEGGVFTVTTTKAVSLQPKLSCPVTM
jgi:hypothetical protein